VAADRPAAAGKRPAEAERDAAEAEKKEADVSAEAEVEEEEEAAPSPWSIPLTLVGDMTDFDEDDDWQPTGSDSVTGDRGPETAPASG